MKRYRKKPIIVEAEQWTLSKKCSVEGVHIDNDGKGYYVITIHGQKAYLESLDWIIKEPDGKHFYPCKPDIFEATYEEVK